MFHSRPMQERMEKSFQKRLEKDTKSAQVDLNKFMRREFACEADARKESEICLDQHPFHKLVDLDIVTKCKRAGQKRGRPKKGEDMVTVYQVLARLEINEEILEKARHKLGRFILGGGEGKRGGKGRRGRVGRGGRGRGGEGGGRMSMAV